MAKLTFTGNLKNGKSGINTKLSLLSFVEDDTHIIYSPALDLSGYGSTEEEAKQSFEIVLSEFIGYCMNKQTLFKELKKLGWDVQEGKKHPKIKSPDWSDLIKCNSELENILENKNFTKFNQDVNLLALA